MVDVWVHMGQCCIPVMQSTEVQPEPGQGYHYSAGGPPDNPANGQSHAPQCDAADDTASWWLLGNATVWGRHIIYVPQIPIVSSFSELK